MIDVDDPLVRKHVEEKARLRERASRASSNASSSRSAGGASGQREVQRWIKLDLGRPVPATHDPWADGDAFELTFSCESTGATSVSVGALKAANGGRWSAFGTSWHCVTGWSRLGLDFRGVALEVALERAFGKRDVGGWRCLYQTSADGYTVGVDARDCKGAFLAVTDADGHMLSRDHGGPRLVFPALYGWKSAKYLSRIELKTSYENGFWENLGCHARGRWRYEERWKPGTPARVWNVLAWITDRYYIGGERVWIWVMVYGGRALGMVASLFAKKTRK